jgi:hypothetical protein
MPAQSPSPRRTVSAWCVGRRAAFLKQACNDFLFIQMFELRRGGAADPFPNAIFEPADAPSRTSRSRPGCPRARARGSTSPGSARSTARAVRAAAAASVGPPRERPADKARGWPPPLRRGGPRRIRPVGRRSDATTRTRPPRGRRPGRIANLQLYESTGGQPRSEHRPSRESLNVSAASRTMGGTPAGAGPRPWGYSAASRLRPCSSCARCGSCSRAGEDATAAKRLQANRTPATTK